MPFFLVLISYGITGELARGAKDLPDLRNQNAKTFSPEKPPPAELAGWIKRGGIRWCYGPPEDGRRIESGSPMAAETSYKVAFNYRSRIQWRRKNGKLFVYVRRLTISWKPKHVVWFRERPTDVGFWDNQLVRHELDHVKISSDPRLEKLCRDRISRLKVLEGAIPSDGNDQAAANTILRERVQEIFQDVSDLAQIRYKELDRLTRHGLKPLPNEIDWVPKGDLKSNMN